MSYSPEHLSINMSALNFRSSSKRLRLPSVSKVFKVSCGLHRHIESRFEYYWDSSDGSPLAKCVARIETRLEMPVPVPSCTDELDLKIQTGMHVMCTPYPAWVCDIIHIYAQLHLHRQSVQQRMC